MKTLSLTQPWASLVILGLKRIETRGWWRDYRGPLAIHAAKGFPLSAQRFAAHIQMDYGVRLPDPFPLGCVLGTVELVDIYRTEDLVANPRLVEAAPLTDMELAFGDYSPRRFGWILRSPVPFPEPIPARGALSLWEWDPGEALPSPPVPPRCPQLTFL